MSKIEASPRGIRSGTLTNGKAFSPPVLFCAVAQEAVVSVLLSRDVPCLSSLCFELLDFLDELLLSLQRLKQHTGMSIQKLE